MIQLIFRFIIGFITSVSGFIYIKRLTLSSIKFYSLKTIIYVFILSLFTPILYKIDYQVITPLITFFAAIIVYKQIFDFDYFQTSIITAIFMFSLVISELVQSVIFLKFFSLYDIRTNYILMVCTNLLTCLIVTLISRVKILNEFINRFILKKEPNKIVKIVVFLTLGLIAISCLLLLLFNNYGFNLEVVVIIVSIVLFLILIFVYLKEQLKYNDLKMQVESLMKPVNQFEEWLEMESINRHEYKNNLAILRDMIKSKKAQQFIDNKLNNSFDLSFEYIEVLKNVPSGGLKGLLVYKLIDIKRNNLNFNLDVSKSLKKYVSKLENHDFQNLCYLLGIFIDNAIEASELSDEKKLSIEMYIVNKNVLKIVISNTFVGKVNIDKVYLKGYTTKGKGRGNGLYFVKKIIKNNTNIHLKNSIINNYYIQEVEFIIKKHNKSSNSI